MAGETRRRVEIILSGKDEFSAVVGRATTSTQRLALMTERYADVTNTLAQRAQSWGRVQVAAATASQEGQEKLQKVTKRLEQDMAALGEEQQSLGQSILQTTSAIEDEALSAGGLSAGMAKTLQSSIDLVNSQDKLVQGAERYANKQTELAQEMERYEGIVRNQIALEGQLRLEQGKAQGEMVDLSQATKEQRDRWTQLASAEKASLGELDRLEKQVDELRDKIPGLSNAAMEMGGVTSAAFKQIDTSAAQEELDLFKTKVEDVAVVTKAESKKTASSLAGVGDAAKKTAMETSIAAGEQEQAGLRASRAANAVDESWKSAAEGVKLMKLAAGTSVEHLKSVTQTADRARTAAKKLSEIPGAAEGVAEFNQLASAGRSYGTALDRLTELEKEFEDTTDTSSDRLRELQTRFGKATRHFSEQRQEFENAIVSTQKYVEESDNVKAVLGKVSEAQREMIQGVEASANAIRAEREAREKLEQQQKENIEKRKQEGIAAARAREKSIASDIEDTGLDPGVTGMGMSMSGGGGGRVSQISKAIDQTSNKSRELSGSLQDLARSFDGTEEHLDRMLDELERAGRSDDAVTLFRHLGGQLATADERMGDFARETGQAQEKLEQLSSTPLHRLNGQLFDFSDALKDISGTSVGILSDQLDTITRSSSEAVPQVLNLASSVKRLGRRAVEAHPDLSLLTEDLQELNRTSLDSLDSAVTLLGRKVNVLRRMGLGAVRQELQETINTSAVSDLQRERDEVRQLIADYEWLKDKKQEVSRVPVQQVVEVQQVQQVSGAPVAMDPNIVLAQQKAITQLNESLTNFSTYAKAAATSSEVAEAGLTELGGRVGRMVDRMKKAREANTKLREKNNQLIDSFREQAQIVSQYREDLKKSTSNEERLIKVVAAKEKELGRMNRQHADTVESLGKIEGRLQVTSNLYKESSQRVAELEGDVKALNIQTEKAAGEATQYQIALEYANRNIQNMREAQATLTEEVRRGRTMMKDMRDQAEGLRGRYDALKTKTTELAADKRALSKALESAEKKSARFGSVAQSLKDSYTQLSDKMRSMVKENDVYTGSLSDATRQANEMAKSVASLMQAQGNKAKETKQSTTTHHTYTKAMRGATSATRDGDRANKDYLLTQGHMRGATSGLRHMLGRLRNTLLLVTFAFGSFFYTIGESIRAANEMESALLGLSSVARSTGQSVLLTNDAALELSRSGLLSVKESSEGLRNLLAAGFGMKEATDMMNTLTDAAAFNRQGTLALGQAVVGATQGIKNQNSIMVDNAGITKNLSIMYKEYAQSIGTTAGALSETQKNQAIYNGVLREGAIFAGDASKASGTLAGMMSRLSVTVFGAQAAFGKELQPVLRDFVGFLEQVITGTMEWIAANRQWIQADLIGGIKEFASAAKPVLGLLIGFTTETLKWASENRNLVAALLAISPAIKIFSTLQKAYTSLKLAVLSVETVVRAAGMAQLQNNVALGASIMFKKQLAAQTIQAQIAEGGLSGAMTRATLAAQVNNAALAKQILTTKSLSTATIKAALDNSKFVASQGAALTAATATTGALGKLKMAMMSLFSGPQAVFMIAIAALAALGYAIHQWYTASDRAREANLSLAQSQMEANDQLREQEARAGATAVAVRDLAKEYMELADATQASAPAGMTQEQRRGRETPGMATIPTVPGQPSELAQANRELQKRQDIIGKMIRQMPELRERFDGQAASAETVNQVLDELNASILASNQRLIDLERTQIGLQKSTVLLSDAAADLSGKFGKLGFFANLWGGVVDGLRASLLRLPPAVDENRLAVRLWAVKTGQDLEQIRELMSNPGTEEGALAFERFNTFAIRQLQQLQKESSQIRLSIGEGEALSPQQQRTLQDLQRQIDMYRQVVKETQDLASTVRNDLIPAREREQELNSRVPDNLKEIQDEYDSLKKRLAAGIIDPTDLQELTYTFRTPTEDRRGFTEQTDSFVGSVDAVMAKLKELRDDPKVYQFRIDTKVTEPDWDRIFDDMQKAWSTASKAKGETAFAMNLEVTGTRQYRDAALAVIASTEEARLNAITTSESAILVIKKEAAERGLTIEQVTREKERKVELLAAEEKIQLWEKTEADIARRATRNMTTLQQRRTAIRRRAELARGREVADIRALAGETGATATEMVGTQDVGQAVQTQARVDLAQRTEQEITAALASELLDKRIGIISGFNDQTEVMSRARAEADIQSAQAATAFWQTDLTRAIRAARAEEDAAYAERRATTERETALVEEQLKDRVSAYEQMTQRVQELERNRAQDSMNLFTLEQRQTIARFKETESEYAKHLENLRSLATAQALGVSIPEEERLAGAGSERETPDGSNAVLRAKIQLAARGIQIEEEARTTRLRVIREGEEAAVAIILEKSAAVNQARLHGAETALGISQEFRETWLNGLNEAGGRALSMQAGLNRQLLDMEKTRLDTEKQLLLDGQMFELQLRELQLQSEASYYDRRLELMLRYGNTAQQAQASLAMTAEQMTLDSIERMTNALVAGLSRQSSEEERARRKRIQNLEAENEFESKLLAVKLKRLQDAREKDLNMSKSLAKGTKKILAGGLEFFAKTMAAEMKIKAGKYAKYAVADALSGNFLAAAGHAAAAAKLGAGAVAVGAAGRAAASRLSDEADKEDDVGISTTGSSDRSTTRRVGGTIEARNLDITIAPSITIEGESLYIGEGSVQALESNIGTLAVDAIRDAIETNALPLGEVASEG